MIENREKLRTNSLGDMGDIAQCPCRRFRTDGDIRKTLDSQQQTDTFVEWLSSGRNVDSLKQCPSCRKDTGLRRCPHRIGSAFTVLNAIRDACRYHLESSTGSHTISGENAPKHVSSQSYEEAFPTLGGKATNQTEQAGAVLKDEKSKPKRRIRPAPATEIPRGNAVWSKPVLSNGSKGNISSLPSESPLMLSTPRQTVKTASKTTPVKRRVKRMTPTLLSTTRTSDAALTDKKCTVWGASSNAGKLIGSEGTTNGSATFSTSCVSRDDSDVPEISSNETVSTGSKGVQHTETPITKSDRLEIRKDESTEKQQGRLVQVYATIVRNHLAPSTVLELHLLVRLLTVKKQSENPNSDNEFSSLFPTGSSCRTFAVRVLSEFKDLLCSLGYDIVLALTECPPFNELLPELVESLGTVAESLRQTSLTTKRSSSGIGTLQTPMLTLPFDHERDSRHNFRSREAAVLYKNREESRDSFLYQLRAFQNIRGRELDAAHADRSLQRIRLASREVVRAVFPSNMTWFTEFFCELLLQIGRVPMEETDKEILNITDKATLQKLHKRFSSKEGKTSKSIQKLELEPRGPGGSSGTSHPQPQPQQFFPGHQEFFFIFIQSSDSYNFGVHLKLRLSAMLSKLTAVSHASELENRILQMKMLARFLGFLVFSPNWYASQEDTKRFDNPCDLVPPVLPLANYILNARQENLLVAVVPWVCEFLVMIRWDTLSQRTPYYRELLALLRAIQEDDNTGYSLASICEKTSSQFVNLCLETLFSDTIGLGETSLLPLVDLPKRTPVDDGAGREPLEDLLLNRNFVLASSPHLEGLLTLIFNLKNTKRKIKADAHISPRKLRPHALNATLDTAISRLSFSETYDSNVSTEAVTTESTSDNANPIVQDKTFLIQRKLSDLFFHQHKDLKEICDFVVDKNLKRLALILPQQCIIPAIEKTFASVTDLNLGGSLLAVAERDAVSESKDLARVLFEKSFPESILIFCAPGTHSKVLDVASKLAVAHALQRSESVLRALVHEEIKKKREALLRLCPVENSISTKLAENPGDAVIGSLNTLAALLLDRRVAVFDTRLLSCVDDAIDTCNSWLESKRENGGIIDLTLKYTVTKLDPCGPCVVSYLESCLDQPASGNTRWLFVSGLMGLAGCLFEMRMCLRVLKSMASFFARHPWLDKLLDLGVRTEVTSQGTPSIGGTLLKMLQTKIIAIDRLEIALVSSLNVIDPGGKVASYCLKSLTAETGGICDYIDERNGTLMPELREELKLRNIEPG